MSNAPSKYRSICLSHQSYRSANHISFVIQCNCVFQLFSPFSLQNPTPLGATNIHPPTSNNNKSSTTTAEQLTECFTAFQHTPSIGCRFKNPPNNEEEVYIHRNGEKTVKTSGNPLSCHIGFRPRFFGRLQELFDDRGAQGEGRDSSQGASEFAHRRAPARWGPPIKA